MHRLTHLFDEAQRSVFQLMLGDAFVRFLQSPEYEKMQKAEADL